jgi:endonuclease/exonuclease/phosphatase family metal-dependent hydrolase
MLGSMYVHPYNLAKFTWQFFRMSVADSILSLNGGNPLHVIIMHGESKSAESRKNEIAMLKAESNQNFIQF